MPLTGIMGSFCTMIVYCFCDAHSKPVSRALPAYLLYTDPRAMVPPAGSAAASWASSNAKANNARDRADSKGMFAKGKGKKSDLALGGAAKMRAEASPGVIPLLEGFVPGPVTDMLEVRIPVATAAVENESIENVKPRLESVVWRAQELLHERFQARVYCAAVGVLGR